MTLVHGKIQFRRFKLGAQTLTSLLFQFYIEKVLESMTQPSMCSVPSRTFAIKGLLDEWQVITRQFYLAVSTTRKRWVLLSYLYECNEQR